MALLTRVKSRVTIPAQRKVAGLLEGAYASVHSGRSLDFVDLRPYVPGDDIKDIDWKATARSDDVLVKRYVADRKHTVIVLANTGREMAAAANPDESVADVALMVCGLIGWLAVSHGDYACVTGMAASGVVLPRPTLREIELERMLLAVQAACAPDAPTLRFEELARTVTSATRRRAIVFVVSPDVDLDTAAIASLRRLVAQHQVVHLTITGLDPTDARLRGRRLVDVDTGAALPDYLIGDAQLHRQWVEQSAERAERRDRALDLLTIAHTEIGDTDEVLGQVLGLLGRMRHAARR